MEMKMSFSDGDKWWVVAGVWTGPFAVCNDIQSWENWFRLQNLNYESDTSSYVWENSIHSAHHQLVWLCKRLTAAWPNGHLGWLKNAILRAPTRSNHTAVRQARFALQSASESFFSTPVENCGCLRMCDECFFFETFFSILFYFNVRCVNVVNHDHHG